MNAKKCFSVLVVILALFGICHNQIAIPNQEIVLQFSDDKVTSEETQNAVINVKAQLQLLGANNIQVQEGKDGVLKISYYSDSDVASIKKTLSDNHAVTLDYASHNKKKGSTDVPSDQSLKIYNLDVYEIHDESDTDWDIEGITIVELKSENHRFFNPNVYASIDGIDNTENVVKTTLKVNTHIAIAIDNTSRKIPEARAGPIVLGNS